MLYVLSGASALLAQLAWMRVFSAGLGHEMPAMTGVLTAFFAGLALGAALLDRTVSRSPRPALWYAGLEGFAGIWIVVTTPLLPWVNDAARRWTGLEASPGWQAFIAFALPLAVVGPATAALGATLPAMDRALAPGVPGQRTIALLYACNTFGAVVGVFAAVGWLMPVGGFRATLGVAAALQGACALVAWAVARNWPRPSESASREGTARQRAGENGTRRWSGLRLRVTVALTGALGIAFELLGVRGLAQTTENTIHTYALALAVFLLGTAFGAAAYRWRECRSRSWHLPGCLMLLGGSCLFGTWVIAISGSLLPVLREGLGGWGAEFALAALVFGAPTFWMGAVYADLVQAARSEAGGVGQAMAWNTMGGALAGPVVLGLLLPAIGLKGTLSLVAVGYVLLRPWPWSRGQLVVGLGMLSCIAALPAVFPRMELPPDAQVIRRVEGRLATVSVVRTSDGHRTLRVNNHFQQGGTATASAARRHALIPLLLHPNPQRALFLGVGTGVTLGAVTALAGVRADAVELLPEVVAALPDFAPENQSPERREGIRVVVADARRLVRTTTERYDVVVADLFHPSEDGAGFLYTREHFAALRDRLVPGGLVCQWLPLHQIDEGIFADIARTFLDVFPEASLWLLRSNTDVPVVGLVGRIEGLVEDPEALGRRLAQPGLAANLGPLALNSPARILGSCLAGPRSLRELARRGEVATDDRPRVLFRAGKFAYRAGTGEAAGERLMALLARCDPEFASWLAPESVAGWLPRLEDYRRARDRHLRGLDHDARGRRAEAVEDFVASAAASAEYTGGYSQAVLVASAYARQDETGARRLLERLIAVRPEQSLAGEVLRRLGEKR